MQKDAVGNDMETLTGIDAADGGGNQKYSAWFDFKILIEYRGCLVI